MGLALLLRGSDPSKGKPISDDQSTPRLQEPDTGERMRLMLGTSIPGGLR